ncbi:mitochondrial ribonuclease P catalytic subunit-like isoform X2 [Acipenser ruthenus]|uniref:mitochondrial ribonuclease P catalytic subunit-like isoform X2 n=1 Tax=Acipenser ruthenus TaxID=7906 RepID=UPI002740C8E1|nr:mitochondrial ribonuclease P catalytic subunit-like isoform X2 [Acipenser ruthenus]
MGTLLISCTLNNIYPLLVHSRASCFAVHKNVSSFFKVWVPLKVHRFSTRVGNSHEGDDKRPNTKQKEQSGKVPHALPKSVFAAGTARKKAEFLKQKWGNDFDKELKGPRKPKENNIPSQPLSAAQWKKLKDDARASHHFEVSMMEKMLAANSDIDVAKSLLAYVAMETGTVSYELLLRYLTLCVHGNHESEVFDVYDIMKKRFKTLETGAYSLFIKGFSRTEKWRECLLLLESIKRVITPSPRNYGHAINGALLHSDSRTAWVLYEEMVEKGLTPNQETWQAFFDSDRSAHDSESKLSSLLLYMRNNQIYPGEALVKSIKAWFESVPGNKWNGSWTTPENSGHCRNCCSSLESIQLTEDEYNQLKEKVMNDVIQGKDVFKKTTPQLLEVVSHLAQQNLRLLVLGRKHMLRGSRSWDRKNMSVIQQKADCFFTDNISEDDPFLLYATLHSGNHCKFLSRDLMRDHKACLPDSSTRRLFFKWQRGHQLVLSSYTAGRRIRFETVPKYDTIIQTEENSWHIPYDEDGVERYSYEVPRKWLCLEMKR